MIDPSAPFRVAATKLKSAFPDLDDQVVVLIRSGTADEAKAFTESLAERLRDDENVESLLAPPAEPFFQENGLLFLETTELEDLLARLTNAAPLIERLGPDPTLATLFDALAEAAEQDGASADPETLDALYAGLTEVFTTQDTVLSWEKLLSVGEEPEPEVLLTIEPVLDFTKLKPAQGVKTAILDAAAAVRSEDGLEAEVLITGEPILRTEELEAVSQGIGWALALSGVLVAVLLAFAFRSLRLVAACLVTIALSVILTAGVATALFGQLNLISVAFAVLMVGLGADFSIHLLMHWKDERGLGASERAAGYRTARKIGTALMLTAPTTALAFFSFAPTEFIGMNQLGVIAGLGVLLAFLIAMTVLPAMVRIGETVKPVDRLPEGLMNKVIRPLGIVVGALGIVSLFLLPYARFDADPMALRAVSAPSVIAFNEIADDEDAAPYRLSVLAESEDELLARADGFSDAETVSSTRHLFSFVPEDQDLKLTLIDAASVGLSFALISGGDLGPDLEPALGRLLVALREEESEAARTFETVLRERSLQQLESAAPRVFRFWPRQREALNAQLRAGFVTREDLPDPLAERFVTESGTYRLEILPEGDASDLAARRDFVDQVLSIAPDAAGSARTALSAGDVIEGAMVQASLTAAVLVSLLVLVVTRSIKVLVLLLIPLLLAGSLTTATGTLFGLPYNFANVLVLPLIIGIGIDSGIHLALRAEKTGDPLAGVRGPTGRAVVYSALTTIASFGSLIVSAHRGTSSMGALLTIGMLWVLATMLFVLPPLAQLLYDRKRSRLERTSA
nr:MMPL family transporter [Parvularcula maris]